MHAKRLARGEGSLLGGRILEHQALVVDVLASTRVVPLRALV
jgi:hypothetical protein